jgi:hypothetical protein
VTLLDLHPTRWSSRGDGANTIDGVVETVIAGAHLPTLAGVHPHAISITIHGLLETFAGVWPESGMLSVQGGPHCRGESADVDLADGIRLEVGVSSQPDLQRGQEIPRQSANAWLHFADPAALAQAESLYVEPLRDFVLFATRRPTYVTSMTIYRDQALRDGLRLLRSPHPQPTELATRPVDALALNLRDIADPAAMLARWFELRQQVGPVWSLLFSTLQGGGLLEDRFLGIVAFAEGYHRVLHDDAPLSPELDKQTKTAIMDAIEDKDARRVYRQALAHANSQTLRDRLDRLCERTLETIAWELDVPNFCAAMVHTRNWMVHWGQRGQQAVEDPAALVMLL